MISVMSFKSINPSNGEVIASHSKDSEQTIKEKIHLSENAFIRWKNSPFQERKELLKRCAASLRTNKKDFAQVIHAEMGKVLPECEAEIDKCAWVCEYYADNGEQFLRNELLEVHDNHAEVNFTPLGAVLAIMPWNFPFWQVFRFAAPSIMAGNVALLKHAPNVFGCAKAIEQVFEGAKAPTGIFQSLYIEIPEIESIIAHPAIKAVTLTGSERAGKSVASLAGKYIKKSVLELGGSDPFIVLEDADINKAMEVAIISRMRNAGQSCIAAKRFIVQEGVFSHFVEKFKEATLKLKKDIDYGPLARVDLAETLEHQTNLSIELGATLVCGGQRDEAYFEPTIISNVKSGMPAYHEELFGPVASVIKVENMEEAIRIANDTNFGLGASIWSDDVNKAREMALQIEAGSVYINQLVASDPRIPFGGIKNSGYGRELSLWGIREFVNIKPIVG